MTSGSGGLSVGSLIGYLRIDGATQADQDILRVQGSLNSAAGAATRMGAAVGESEGALTGAGRAAGTLSAASGRLRASQLSVLAAQERYNTLVNAGNAPTARLASAEATLIRANGQLAASTRAATAESEAAAAGSGRFTAAIGSTVAMAGKLGLALGAFELLKKAFEDIKAGKAFQQQMLQIETQAGASAAEVKTMTGAILGLAGPTATAPLELATSLYHVESVGLRAGQALDVVRIAAEGAKVGNADLEQTTNALTATVASGIPGVKNMSQAMGALNSIVGAGDMKLSDLNEALGTGVLTVVKGYGLSLTDVGAALATFGDNNIRGADAATMLRMAVQAMAHPAAEGKDTFDKLGLSTKQLAVDMQTGGLNKAVLDLKSHLDKAGVSGVQVGATLTDAFGKKAGPGLAVLMGQVDRFESKIGVVNAGAGRFGADWLATTQTASFAFARLGAEAQAAGIQVFNKLEGPVTSAAVWLGTNLPRAIAAVGTALGPTERELSAVFIPAWHALSTVLGDASGALQHVGGFLSGQGGAISVIVPAVLGMWAAWKGYQIVKTAAAAVSSAIDTIRLKAMAAGESLEAMGTVSLLALGGIGLALGAASYLYLKHASAVQAAKAQVEAFTDALKEDSGAIGDNTQAAAANALQKAGALTAANKLGVSLLDVTAATLGNSDAMGRINAAYQAFQGNTKDLQQQTITGTTAQKLHAQAMLEGGGALSQQSDQWNILNTAVGGGNDALNKAVQASKNVAGAEGKSTDAIGKTAAASTDAAKAMSYQVDAAGNLSYSVTQATTSISQQTTASDLLKSSLDALSGAALGVEQTEDTLSLGLVKLANKTGLAKDANNNITTSLSQSTEAGIQNRQMLTTLITNANSHAEAVANQTASVKGLQAGLKAGTATLANDEAGIRKAAAAAGLNKQQVDAMITSLGKIPVVSSTNIQVKTTQAQSDLSSFFAKIPNIFPVTIQLKTTAADVGSSELLKRGFVTAATGGTVHGPGTSTSDSVPAMLSTGEEVISAKPAAKFRPLLKAINSDSVPGFAAGGTVAARAAASAALARSNAQFTISADVGKVLGAGTLSAVQSAVASLITAVHNGIAKGVGSAGLVAQLQGDNNKIAGLVNKRAKDLASLTAVQAKLAADEASYSQEVGTVRSSIGGGFNLGSIASGLGSSFDAFGGTSPAVGASGLISALQSQVGSEQSFTAGLITLRKRGLSSTLIQQLAEAGPSSAGQAVSALASGSASQIGQVNKLFATSNSIASAAGGLVGGSLFGSAISADAKRVGAASGVVVMDDKTVARIQAAIVAGVSKIGIQVNGVDAISKNIKFEIVANNAELLHALRYG